MTTQWALKLWWWFDSNAYISGFIINEVQVTWASSWTIRSFSWSTIWNVNTRDFTVPWPLEDGAQYKYTLETYIETWWTIISQSSCDSKPDCEQTILFLEEWDLTWFCDNYEAYVVDAPVNYYATWEWELTDIVYSSLNDYVTNIYDLWDSNKASNPVTAKFWLDEGTYYASASFWITWKQAWKPPIIAVHENTAWNYGGHTSNRVYVNAYVTDEDWRAVVNWTPCSILKDNGESATSMSSTSNWFCNWSVVFWASEFNTTSNDTVNLTVQSNNGQVSDPYAVTLVKDVVDLNLNDLWVWAIMPNAQLFPWKTFSIPIYAKYSWTISAYAFEITYDDTVFEPITSGWKPVITKRQFPTDPLSSLIWNVIGVSSADAAVGWWLTNGQYNYVDLNMKVRDDATPGAIWDISIQVTNFEDEIAVQKKSLTTTIVSDIDYAWETSYSPWSLIVRTVGARWTLFSAPEYQLFNYEPITGTDITTQIVATNYSSNDTSASVSPTCANTIWSSIDVSAGCLVTAIWSWASSVDVSYGWDTETLYFNVYHPDMSTLDLVYDDNLQYIDVLDEYQTTEVKLNVTFKDDSNQVEVNVINRADLSVIDGDFTVTWNEIDAWIGNSWTWTVIVKKADLSATLISWNLQEPTDSNTALIEKIIVLLPKTFSTSLTTISVVPWSTPQIEAKAYMKSILSTPDDTIEIFTRAMIDDWNYMPLDAASQVDLFPAYFSWGTLTWESIISVDTGALLASPEASWLWIVYAQLKDDPSVVWKWYVCAEVPDPKDLQVMAPKVLAINATDPITDSSFWNLSIQQSITDVVATYSGSAFTKNYYTSAIYTITSWSWKFALTWAYNNEVISLNNWFTETWEVLVTVNIWSFVLTWTVAVSVRWVDYLEVRDFTEHCSWCAGWTINDSAMNIIEGTTVYQNIYSHARQYYTNWAYTTIDSSNKVTRSENSDNIEFASSTSNRLLVSAWWIPEDNIEVTYTSWPFSATWLVSVSGSVVDIEQLVLTRSGNAPKYLLNWAIDSASKTIYWYVVLSDSTRRYITWNNASIWGLIPGLLQFTEDSGSWVITIDADSWEMILRANWETRIQSTVVNDAWATTAPVWSWAIVGNLTPLVWDIDLWKNNDIALEEDWWGTLSVEVRVNWNNTPLWAFSVFVDYDDSKLLATDITKWSSLQTTFSFAKNLTFDTNISPGKTRVSMWWYEEASAKALWSNDLIAVMHFDVLWSLDWVWLTWEIGYIKNGDGSIDIKKSDWIIFAWSWLFIDNQDNHIVFNDSQELEEWKSFYANMFNTWIFDNISAFFKWLFEVWKEVSKDSKSFKANIFDDVYVSSWWEIPKIWDMDNSCSVDAFDARAVMLFWLRDPAFYPLTKREHILWDVKMTLDWNPWDDTDGILWSDAILINRASQRNSHFLEWVTAKANSWWDVTFRVYIIDYEQNPVINDPATIVEIEYTPLWAWWSWSLLSLTHPVGERYWEWTVVWAPSTGQIAVYFKDTAASDAADVIQKYSKMWSPAPFKPLADFSNEDTEWNFNTIFWKYYPVWCGDDLNFPPTEIDLTSYKVASWGLVGAVVWWISTIAYDWNDSTYELVSWFWDNADFTIDGSTLKLATWAKISDYKIRIRATDAWSINWTNKMSYEEQFTLTSGPPSQEPSVIWVSLSIDEEQIHQFDQSDFTGSFISWASWAAMTAIKFTSLPTNAQIYSWAVSYSGYSLVWSWVLLSWSWTAFTNSGIVIPLANIWNYYFVPDVDYFGPVTFQWNWYDANSNWSLSDADITFSIAWLFDTPIIWSWSANQWFRSSWITVLRQTSVDTSWDIYFKIVDIVWGELYFPWWAVPITTGSFITETEWYNWLEFLSTTANNWSFSVQASSSWSDAGLSPQSAIATALIEVTPAWEVNCWFSLANVDFSGTSAQASAFRMYYDTKSVTWSYFWCEDLRASDTEWWQYKIWITDLTRSWATSTAYTLASDDGTIRIYHTDETITPEYIWSWSLGFSSEISSDLTKDYSLWQNFPSVPTVDFLLMGIKSVIPWSSDIQWYYKIKPTISVDVPAYHAVGTYKGTMTLDLSDFTF